MDWGAALAAGLGGAMTNEANVMAQEEKERGLLERMMLKEQLMGNRQMDLLNARIDAKMAGLGGSGSSGKSGGSATLGLLQSLHAAPEEQRALAAAQAGGTLDDLNRAMQTVGNPGAMRDRQFEALPADVAGPPKGISDEEWHQKHVVPATHFLSKYVAAFGRMNAGYQDIGKGDQDQASLDVARNYGRGMLDETRASNLNTLIHGKSIKEQDDVTQLKAGTMTNMLSDITRQEEVLRKAIAESRKLLSERSVPDDAKQRAAGEEQEAINRLKLLDAQRNRLLSSSGQSPNLPASSGNIGAGASAPANRAKFDQRPR